LSLSQTRKSGGGSTTMGALRLQRSGPSSGMSANRWFAGLVGNIRSYATGLRHVEITDAGWYTCPVMGRWHRFISVFKEWGWLALSLASGGPTVVFALIFWLQGREPPKNWLVQLLLLCSLVAAWMVGLRERKARLVAENPFKAARPNILPMSASVVRSGFCDGQFIPQGSRYAAVCCFYYHEGEPTLKDVRAQIVFRNSQTGEEYVRVNAACWLHERKPTIIFRAATTRHVMVAEWGFRQPVVVPRFLAGEVENVALIATENVDVTVALCKKDGTLVSEFYYRMLPGINKDEGFNRLCFEVKRD
jgi:hypothetical protein